MTAAPIRRAGDFSSPKNKMPNKAPKMTEVSRKAATIPTGARV